MTKSENLNELCTALAKAQGEMGNARKDAENPFFKSNYATLGSVWDAIRIPLSKHGLSVVQTTEVVNEKIVVITTLLHSSGQYIQGTLPVLNQKQDPQSLGSAISYNRRYGLMGIVGIAAEDDDAESAVQRPALRTSQQSKPAVPSAAVARHQPPPQQTQGELSATLNRMRTPGAMPSRS